MADNIRLGFPGQHSNDDAHPGGIAVGLDPIACRACKFVGTILDIAILCDDAGKLTKDVVCGRCSSPDLDWDPPPLRAAAGTNRDGE